MIKYNLRINHAVFRITDERLKKTTPQGLSLLKEEYDADVSWKYFGSQSFYSPTLQYYVERFSEQLVLRPEQELIDWFNYSTGRMINVIYSDLYYLVNKDYGVNISAVSAIGEGIAAYILQKKFGFLPVARPLNYMPDIIMIKGNTIALVEAKASLRKLKSTIRSTIKSTAVELLDLIAKARYHKPDYLGYVIGTEILDVDKFESYVLELTV